MMLIEWEENKNNNFIAGGYIDEKVCDNLIEYFENCKYKRPGEVGSNNQGEVDSFIKDKVKKSTDLAIAAVNIDRPIQDYYPELNKVLDFYKDKYKYCHEGQGAWTVCENWNIQKYEPKEGFYAWHTERINITNCSRHLVFMTYLNDVNDGGETEFFYQNIKVKPKKGLTIFWPADWTFTHRGITSNTEIKYITTGWYSYY